MLRFLKDRRNFNTPVTVTRDTIVTQSTPPSGIPSINEYEDRLAPTPEFLETEPVQEEIIKPKTTRKKKTDEGY